MSSDPSSEQILTTMATHMLDRAILLFSPVETPGEALMWGDLQRPMNHWVNTKRDRLSEWMDNRAAFMVDSEERYLQERTKLLNDLQKSGRYVQTALAMLERSLRTATQTVETTNNGRPYASHVHISQDVMDELDRLYCEVFRGNTHGFALHDCFNVLTHETGMEAFTNYLVGVEDILTRMSKVPEAVAAHRKGCSQTRGLHFAIKRVFMLFLPVDGRICLPLPTTTMLDDLRTCVLTDCKVIPMVGSSPRWVGGNR
jgi:hypothetical protein